MTAPRYWAVIPAAGIGRRMASDIPKQYLPFAGRTVIDHTLETFLVQPEIEAVYLALAEGDDYWQQTEYADHPGLVVVPGGAERSYSVLNALDALSETAAPADWVLVHDAARPCLHRHDIEQLLKTLSSHPVGGLLGVPVHDTVKRTDAVLQIQSTIDRTGLWRAFTPQMFRLGALRQALTEALRAGVVVTDESSAMELAGFSPRMVEGRSDNIKITSPADLPLAEFQLSLQKRD